MLEGGSADESLVQSDRALALARDSGDLAGEARSHASRAEALEQLDRTGEAIAAWREAASSWRRTGDAPGQIEALTRASILLRDRDERGSASLVAKALGLASLEETRPCAAAVALQEAGVRAFESGDRESAREIQSAAVSTWERHRPGSPDLADSLLQLARVEWEEGAVEVTREHLLRALTIQEAIDTESEQVARILVKLGNSEMVIGLIDAAEAHYLRSMEIRENLGADPRIVADALPGLGMLSVYRGDMGAARAYFERSVRIEEEYGKDPVELARMLINLGWVPSELLQYAEARRIFQRALALLEEHAPDHPARAKVLSNLSEIAIRQGDMVAAEEHAQLALECFEKSMPGSLEASMTLSRLGRIADDREDWALAMEYHRRALAIRENLIPDSYWVAEGLHFLGSSLLNFGDIDAAHANEEKALAITRKPDQDDKILQAQIQLCLGQIARHRGDLVASEEWLRSAIASWQAWGGSDHFATGAVYMELAGTLSAQENYGDAFEAALRADQISRTHNRLTVRSLPEREGLMFVSGVAPQEVMLSLAAEPLGRGSLSAEIAWDTVIRSRALVLDEMAARHEGARLFSDPEVTARYSGLRSARERLAKLVVRGPGEDDPGDFQVKVRKARREKETAEMGLAAVSASFRRDQARNRAGLQELHASLSQGDAVVAFVRFRRLGFDVFPHDWVVSEEHTVTSYLAFVLPAKGEEPLLVDLGGSERIDAAVSEMRERIASVAAAGDRSPKRAEASFRAAAENLRRMIWDPVEPHVGRAERLFVVPDGELHLVNFAALPVGANAYLIESGTRVHYLSAERDLVGEIDKLPAAGLLALGAPAFDEPRLFASLAGPLEADLPEAPITLASATTFRGSRSSCGDFQTMQFEPLPSSAEEVSDVIGIWAGRGELPGGTTSLTRRPAEASKVVQLTRAAASEQAFKATAAGNRVLHLATHGFFLGGACPSALDAEGPNLIGENPLLLSGLALAGANHREAAGPEEEDGILTAEEIAALDLTGVEWAVLSACDTGVGEVRAGEGVFGLRRAFQIAGARTLIMSLWQVADEASREWMKRLYENRFVGGMSTVDSVHEASLALLNERREKGLSTHPFYWAGFVAAGDWR